MDPLLLLLLLALQATTTTLEQIQRDPDWPTPPAPSDKTAVNLDPSIKSYLQTEGKERYVKLYGKVS